MRLREFVTTVREARETIAGVPVLINPTYREALRLIRGRFGLLQLRACIDTTGNRFFWFGDHRIHRDLAIDLTKEAGASGDPEDWKTFYITLKGEPVQDGWWLRRSHATLRDLTVYAWDAADIARLFPETTT